MYDLQLCDNIIHYDQLLSSTYSKSETLDKISFNLETEGTLVLL